MKNNLFNNIPFSDLDFCIKPDVQQKHGAGLVFTCGQNDVGQLGLGIDIDERSRPTAVKELNNILDISAGGMHTLCIDRDGKVSSEPFTISLEGFCSLLILIFCVGL